MTAQVIRFPDMSICDARQIIARPNLHEEGAVLDACELLEARGDWMDYERAKALKAAMIRDAIDEINRKGRRREKLRRIGTIAGDALGALSLFVLLYLFLLFTPG
jgi:4-alpha-glucanotransferase